MTLAEKRYQLQPDFAALVDMLTDQIIAHGFTPEDLRQAVDLALRLGWARAYQLLDVNEASP